MTTTTRKRSPEREQFLKDLLITAVEGGINYWACVQGYDPDTGTVTVFEEEYVDTDDEKPYPVTMDTIAHGIALAKEQGIGSLSGPDYVKEFFLADRTNGDEGDYDADIADTVLQLGLFNEVIHG